MGKEDSEERVASQHRDFVQLSEINFDLQMVASSCSRSGYAVVERFLEDGGEARHGMNGSAASSPVVFLVPCLVPWIALIELE